MTYYEFELKAYIDKLITILKKKYMFVDIGNKEGPSAYIDFIEKGYFNDKDSVIYGKDKYGRYFFTVKLLINNNIFYQTLFQRYTDNPLFWRGCSLKDSKYLIYNSTSYIGIPQLTFFIDILEGKTIKITKEHGLISDYFTDKFVFIINEEKLKAIKLIQKTWRKARYDPSYKCVKESKCEI